MKHSHQEDLIQERGQITDDYILNKLNKNYRDNPEELNMIERAYHASGKQHILPIEMTPESSIADLKEFDE
jgi:hypothetical protein